MTGDEDDRAKLFRVRAARLREIAAATPDKNSRELLIKVAEDYEGMVKTRDWIEQDASRKSAK